MSAWFIVFEDTGRDKCVEPQGRCCRYRTCMYSIGGVGTSIHTNAKEFLVTTSVNQQ